MQFDYKKNFLAPALDMLYASDFFDTVQDGHVFVTVQSAILAAMQRLRYVS